MSKCETCQAVDELAPSMSYCPKHKYTNNSPRLEILECKCACHDQAEPSKPYLHDTQCCVEMIGRVQPDSPEKLNNPYIENSPQYFAYNEAVEKIQKNIGLLRQALNEDRITDPKKMIDNEYILSWLELD